MANSWIVVLLGLACFTPKTWANFFLDGILGDIDSCEDVCDNTYPLHTYEKSIHLGFCRRGCRLFTMIDFSGNFDDLNQTRTTCVQACSEAHGEEDNKNACNLGCSSQMPVMQRRQQQLQNMEMQDTAFFPLLYVHNLYSNMVDKLSSQMSTRWTFYSQSNNGPLIVIQSEPTLFFSESNNDVGEREQDDQTSNYIESSLAEVDNSATPDIKSSQINLMQRDLGDDRTASAQAQPSDWLSCISNRTGVPKMVLSGTIFVSAFVMIWICLSSAVTAPEQRVSSQPQKLSIYGDLEYLREFGDKPLVSSFPQELNLNAAPLPIKVKVERI